MNKKFLMPLVAAATLLAGTFTVGNAPASAAPAFSPPSQVTECNRVPPYYMNRYLCTVYNVFNGTRSPFPAYCYYRVNGVDGQYFVCDE